MLSDEMRPDTAYVTVRYKCPKCDNLGNIDTGETEWVDHGCEGLSFSRHGEYQKVYRKCRECDHGWKTKQMSLADIRRVAAAGDRGGG